MTAGCNGSQYLHDAIEEKERGHSRYCSLCDSNEHWEVDCPWMDSQCLKFSCPGTRKILTSNEEDTYGEKYLKCDNCHHFQWLNEAIDETKSVDWDPILSPITSPSWSFSW